MKKAAAILAAIALALSPIGAAAGGDSDAELLAKMLYGECGGVESDMEKAACAWVVLNRVDAEGYPDTARGVVEAKGQFVGYRAGNPVRDDLLALAEDVLGRWEREKAGEESAGRVLPAGFLWFSGDGKRNRFRDWYRGGNGYWDWSLPDPYDS
jgi:hypothetical protein